MRLMPVTLLVALKILGVAFAVGLDVLALSIAIGIMQSDQRVRLRLAIAFSVSEVVMQVVGYLIGAGVGNVIGEVAPYLGFAVLALVGAYIVRESYQGAEKGLGADSGWGLILTCASISLDSLGIGVSLPGVPLPLIPLLATVAVSTAIFTTIGLAFGSLLGKRYEALAERTAGIVLVLLAILFTVQHLEGWAQ
ncbi:MAG TPA: manganese efflux pump [Candidatus Lustribacter sp.]|jgi:putative Mn2+ efflux pump MntP|nr:manganese efflux pump [Candidatus Lustribacter sp.]